MKIEIYIIVGLPHQPKIVSSHMHLDCYIIFYLHENVIILILLNLCVLNSVFGSLWDFFIKLQLYIFSEKHHFGSLQHFSALSPLPHQACANDSKKNKEAYYTYAYNWKNDQKNRKGSPTDFVSCPNIERPYGRPYISHVLFFYSVGIFIHL